MISSCNSTKGSYHSSSQQFTLGGVQSKLVNSIQRLLKFFSNSGEPPLSTSAPCSGSRQDPSIPQIVLRTPRSILLGRPPVVPAFPIHPGASQQKRVLFRAWARSESSWHGFASRRSVPRGSGLTVTRISFEPRSHPQEENQSFNYYASTVRLLYPRHKVTTLGKKKILIKMQYHANSFVLFGTRFKYEQRLPLSRLLRLQHSTKKLPGKRKALQLQHAWIWQTFFFFFF